MLSPFNANRLRLCLQRERENLAHALGRKRRAHEKAWEKAQRACEYLHQAGQLLVSQGLPAVWEVRLQPTNTLRQGAVRIAITLDGADLGRFLINDDWLPATWSRTGAICFLAWHCALPAATWRARSPILSLPVLDALGFHEAPHW